MPRSIACRLFKGESLVYHPTKVIFETFDITFLECAPVLNFDDQEIAGPANGAVNRAAGNMKRGSCRRIHRVAITEQLSRSSHDGPVFAAIAMALQAQSAALAHQQSLEFVAGA